MPAAVPFKKRLIARLLILALLFGAVWLYRYCQQGAQLETTPQQQENTGIKPSVAVPVYVLEVLRHVRQYGKAPEGYVGGREFQNREKRLPLKTPDGQKIRYSEWDVQPKVAGRNRGAERLVTGTDHRAWFTKDHYKTFVEIRE